MHRHHYHKRQIETPIFETFSPIAITASTQPSATAANAVVSDIEEITKGLADLPGDLLNFIEAIEQRLEALESILAGLLATETPATSTVESTPPITSASSTSLFTTIPSSILHVTRTITSTSRHTVFTEVPYGYGNETLVAYGSGTVYAGYPTTSASSVNASIVPVTVTVQYASPTSSGATLGNGTASTFVTYSLSPSPTPYTFQPNSSDNVAVYYGQTPVTQQGGLLALCESPNVDIVILAFVSDFFTQEGYPTANFGPGCTSQTPAQMQRAPGLMDCSVLGAGIAGCQEIGKPVLVSLGGYIANSSFTSDAQATQFAVTIWNLFGAGTGEDPSLRPLGPDIVVDGFDIDNENHDQTYWTTFATALRQQFSQDSSKTYYLSAAPQCIMPDASIPMAVMDLADFVWVQFYNNPQCNLDEPGFLSAFAAWSHTLLVSSNNTGRYPRMYIGAPAFSGGGSGYVAGSALSDAISDERGLYLSNFGGLMLWDGSEGLANVDQYGENYLQYAKNALQY